MNVRTALVGLGVTAGLLLAATPPDGHVPASTKVYNVIGCVQADDGATCESTSYQLSTAPGESSVGSTWTITPVGSVFYYADGENYTYDQYSPGDGIKGETFVVDASRNLDGQVTLRGYASGAGVPAEAAADAAVSVQIVLREVGPDGKPGMGRRLSAEVEKVVMVPGDNVFAYSIDIPDEFDGREVMLGTMSLAQRGVNVATSGFVDGEGGSWFDLPTYVEETTGA